MIQDILAQWSSLEVVDSAQDVDIAMLEESELELRFLSWLERKVKRLGGRFKAAPVGQGKSGYQFQLGNSIWEIEPQVPLGTNFDVAESARADFLFRQTSGTGDISLPIAVFLDGWKFHRDRIDQDVRQRMAISEIRQFAGLVHYLGRCAGRR